MANTIALAMKYLPILDEVYKQGALSSILDAPADLVRESLNSNEILIPKMTLQGLGDYDRAVGYVAGDVTFSWQTHTFTQDRGRAFMVDAQDNLETVEVAFGRLAGEFIRTYVNPEIDAYRFAKIATKALTIVANHAHADLASTTALQAFDTALEVIENNEVGMENLVAFISPTVKKYLKQSNLISRQFIVNVGSAVVNREIEVLDGMPLITVPQSRFYSAVDLYDGETAGQEAGGFIKNASALDLNFLIVDPNAVLGITKTALPRIFDPETNQDANAWKFDYRIYHDLFILENKVNGLYAHTVGE